MRRFRETIRQLLKDPKFREEFRKMEEEYRFEKDMMVANERKSDKEEEI